MFRQTKALRILAGGIFFIALALAFFLAISGGSFLYAGFWPLILVLLAVSSMVGGLVMARLIMKSPKVAVTIPRQQRYQSQQEVPEVFQKEFARYL